MHHFVDFASLVHVDVGTIEKLRDQGMVKVAESAFGEMQLVLVSEAISIAPAYGVTLPMTAFKVATGEDMLKLPKVSLLIMLHEEGWRPDPRAVAAVWNGPLNYVPGLAQPVSYFAALVARRLIFAKAVPRIAHGGKDHYYRCLLRLPQDKLASVLEDPNRDDAFFRKELKNFQPKGKAGGDDSSDSGSDGGPRDVRARPGGAGAIVAPVAIPIADRIHWSLTQWKRCWVVLGDVRIKVYFDNCCGRNAERRSWANCPTHRCGKIRPVIESRDYTACAFALWYRYGAGHGGMLRSDHMAYWPEDADVRAALPGCSFEEF